MSIIRKARVIIELTNGSTLKGDMIVGPSGRVESVLYQPIDFIEFNCDEGLTTKFISKQQIVSVEEVKVDRRDTQSAA
jgi:hypothetical protein